MTVVLEEVIDIVCVMSAHNDSDIFTKNLLNMTNTQNREKYIWTIEEMNQA